MVAAGRGVARDQPRRLLARQDRTMSGSLAQVLLQVDTTKRPFFYRTDSNGDWRVIEQIFQNGSYDLSHFAQTRVLHSFYLSLLTSNRTALIVDAGANIGASVVYFAGLFPKSKLLAIEPEVN